MLFLIGALFGLLTIQVSRGQNMAANDPGGSQARHRPLAAFKLFKLARRLL